MAVTSLLYAQEDSTGRQQAAGQSAVRQDTAAGATKKRNQGVKVKKDTVVGRKVDAQDSLPSVPVNRKITLPRQVVQEQQTDSGADVAVGVNPFSRPLFNNAAASYVENHPYYGFGSNIPYMLSRWYEPRSKDALFYIFCGVMFFLGILKLGFPKYFQDIFNVFWRSAVRQKQIRDQIQQAGMTTLLFNTFFVFSAALFSYLIIIHTSGYSLKPWLLFAICFVGITAIYISKYFILKLTGWMFGQQEVADAYIFIVFLINKILAIFLVPLMLALAFGDAVLQKIAFTVSIVLLLALLLYRFVLSFSGFRNELKIGIFHLFLFVCGFEIIPVLVVYKLLLQFFAGKS